MELSVTLFILKIIILYIFVPCLLLASIFSLIYTFITTYHDKKNKNRSITGPAEKKIHIQGFGRPDTIIDYEYEDNDDTYYLGDDGNIYKFIDGEMKEK